MSRFLNNNLSSFDAYVPGEQPTDKKYIKLNTNEFPYEPSPRIKQEITKEVIEDLRLYPPTEFEDLKQSVANLYNVDKAQVYVGNGSDEVIAFSYMAFFDKGDKLYSPDITYGFYSVYAKLFNINLEKIALKEDFSLYVEDYINLDANIIIANPNAPSGLVISVDDIERIVKANPDRLVIIDEAYADFWGQSCVSLTKIYDNLLVIQTLSKSRALAGMRIGVAIGSPDLIEDLNKVKFSFHPYNVNRLSGLCAKIAVEDREYFESTVSKVIQTRERIKAELADLGFEMTDSQTNFIFAKTEKISGEGLYLELKNRGILVRHFSDPRTKDYVRISVGTDNEMNILVSSIKDILEKL